MDSGNGSNQAQRYCPTPIMAPPTVATSPPIMSSGTMGSMHQQSHHPPPSISPHPSAYYSHHSTGAGHYPTPSPTPPPPPPHHSSQPPMHHPQYYSYYAHGSHQQQHPQAQQSQQSQPPHHSIQNANSHVSMSTPQSSAAQQSHMMGHGHSSYPHHHAPQHQSHHQQWGAPHQQQSHHYYHQPSHHPPQHQPTHQQPAPQQHYPPPPPSPYSYMPPHPTPTPPPSSAHPQQQQHQQQQQQQQQQLQQQSAAPPPSQQQPQAPPPPAPPPSHALMNLSRFVNQSSPSPCPSPIASPGLGSHHPQQMQQMGSPSPSTFGHHDHLSSMNGHPPAPGHANSPVMSSPPPPPAHHPNVSSQQTMSPPQSSHHPHLLQSQPPPPPLPYSGNVNNGPIEKANHSPNKKQENHRPDVPAHSFPTDFQSVVSKADAEPITTSKIPFAAAQEGEKAQPTTSPRSSVFNSEQAKALLSWGEREKGKSKGNSPTLQQDAVLTNDSVSRPTIGQQEAAPERPKTPDFLKANGGFSTDVEPPNGGGNLESGSGSSRTSMSPQPRPNGSPNSGNGHQMMPVRLQNMQKGARTKASMKKLLQEQHVTTPNGQLSEAIPVESNSAKDVEDAASSLLASIPTGKPTKAPRKKKSQAKGVPSTSQTELNVFELSDSNVTADSSVEQAIRPGYTKHGKKIGRPRKSVPPAEPKVKGRKRGKKAKVIPIPEPEPIQPEVETPSLPSQALVPADDPDPIAVAPLKGVKRRRGSKGRKRTLQVLSLPEEPDLTVTIPDPSESIPTPVPVQTTPKVGGKRRKKSTAIVSEEVIEPVSTDLPSSSEISDVEAKSVALRVIQPTTPTPQPKKGRRKRNVATKAESASTTDEKSVSPRRGKTQAETTAIDADTSPERGELPRLRSRSPKQRESPPLRISSPRAAKERSVTPAGSNPSSTPTRSRNSKEKEVIAGSTLTTPLASPVLRSPKKGKGSPRKNSLPLENMEAPADDLLSPPPTKRTRQMSKESDTVESTKAGRKSRLSEGRASIDLDVSLLSPSLGKRASRRKSGSVTGSTEDLSSGGFKSPTPIPLFPSSEASTEIPVVLDSQMLCEPSPASLLSSINKPLHSSTPLVVKRGKTKKAKKNTKYSRKAKMSLGPEVASEIGIMHPVSDLENQESSLIPPPIELPKPTKQRAKKGYGKRGKKQLTAVVDTLVAPETLQNDVEVPEDVFFAAPIPVPPTIIKKRRKRGTAGSKAKSQKQKKQSAVQAATAVIKIPTPKNLLVPKKKGRGKAGKGGKSKKAKSAAILKLEVVPPVAPEGVSTSLQDTMAPFQPPADLTPKRRRSSATSTNTQSSSAKSDIAHSWSTGERSVSSMADTSLSHLPSPMALPPQPVLSKDELHEEAVALDQAIVVPVKRKRQSRKGRAAVAKDSKRQKLVKPEPKAIMDAEEVAHILLNLNSPSKSPSPAKSIPPSEPKVEAPKKIRKSRKAKFPKNATTSEANNLPPTTTAAPEVSATTSKKKGGKRKPKERRSSSLQQSTLLSSIMELSFGEPESQPLLMPPNTTLKTPVKVAKTAKIPVATNLDQPVLTPKGKQKKSPTKGKRRKAPDASPDITELGGTSPVKAKRGKKSLKPVASVDGVNSLEEIKSPALPDPVNEIASMSLLSPSSTSFEPEGGQVQVKRKRQKKAKIGRTSPDKDSSPMRRTTKLFPYNAKKSPPQIKKPTVFAKSVPGINFEKEEDNHKKKNTQDAPSLRVLGGRTKFYRGGEEDEVDQDPKLPKEKGPLQTDNDVPWECSFCHLGPHAQKLGDLFGPYFADLPSVHGKPSSKRETWMHGDCALWAGRLILVGTYLRRLEETLQNADKETCTICHKTGATIGCLRRGCKEGVHYPCAIRRFWKIDEKNFHSYCPLHKQ